MEWKKYGSYGHRNTARRVIVLSWLYDLQVWIAEYTGFSPYITRGVRSIVIENDGQKFYLKQGEGNSMKKNLEKARMLERVSTYINRFVTDRDSGRKQVDDILNAMDKVDRKYFIDHDPYVDRALSIGHGQTISQPSTVARVLMLADLSTGHDVLEIGFGSGWNACLIAYLVYPGNVTSAEIVPELVALARENLKKVKKNIDAGEKFSRLEIIHENIFKIPHGTYDRIIATAGIGPDNVSRIEILADQLLKDNGILVCPYQRGPMIVMRKINGEVTSQFTQEQYAFVPLIL
jgi:protein-L-isoaspartate(D-aspartate) O-methyltransferase